MNPKAFNRRCYRSHLLSEQIFSLYIFLNAVNLICGFNTSLLISKNWLVLVQNLKCSVNSPNDNNCFLEPSVQSTFFCADWPVKGCSVLLQLGMKCLLKFYWLLLCFVFLFRILKNWFYLFYLPFFVPLYFSYSLLPHDSIRWYWFKK